MRLLNSLLATFIFALAAPVTAEVSFPQKRTTVGFGELYELDKYDDWLVLCEKTENAEDWCFVRRSISEPDAGLALELDFDPFFSNIRNRGVDVDLAPRAFAEIYSLSNAEHYNGLGAHITGLDGMPFDGYRCPLVEGECDQSNELNRRQLDQILAANQAEIEIYDLETDKVSAALQVKLDGLGSALARANAFNNDILGIREDEIEGYERQACTFVFEGKQRRITYTFDEDQAAKLTTLRETIRGPQDGGDCPSYVALAQLTPNLSLSNRKLFCLVLSEGQGIVGIQQGEQNAYRVCKEPTKSFCERINATKEVSLAIASSAVVGAGAAVGTSKAAGITYVAHSSGAWIMTGSSGYIAGTLGTIGTTGLAIVTSPAVLAGGTVTLIAVGSSVWLCQ